MVEESWVRRFLYAFVEFEAQHNAYFQPKVCCNFCDEIVCKHSMEMCVLKPFSHKIGKISWCITVHGSDPFYAICIGTSSASSSVLVPAETLES